MKLNKFHYFYPEKPTLTLMENIHQFDIGWVAEPKYNESRLELHIIDGTPSFYSRHGYPLTYNQNPDKMLVNQLKSMFPTGYYLFDGGLRHNKVTGVRDKIILWDCFIYKNELLNKLSFEERRKLIPNVNGDIKKIEQYTQDFKNVYLEYTGGKYGNPDEFEGIVLKNLKGMLNLGSTKGIESRWMFKIRKQTGRHKF